VEGAGQVAIEDSIQPVQILLRHLPIGKSDKVETELQRLEAAGIIKSVAEPARWVSALLVVTKPNGKVRLCLDPKPYNKALKRLPYCMHRRVTSIASLTKNPAN
jgi:hypothetical protein